MKKEIYQLFCGAVVFMLFLLVSAIDFKDAEAENKLYCEMVSQWYSDAEKGIPPVDRKGWPPFDGEEQCNKG